MSKPKSQPDERADKPAGGKPTEADKERGEGEADRNKPQDNYPPDSLRNPLPGLDPQQTPGSDRNDL
ncbi:hypothetical protein CEK29_10645 [Bordetella genomosp. 5]|uniref:Uncharacterized protein n=1 Tax=Bordetella genomosp. 5 TaxID=1395608 RepID=A0A261TR55_9BORD|nr:hypothetical protein [Bordetella genomosp. 5]OZI43600.1 hypothetical protein CEK29_10645 [Bordetella genomosp. 5]OZI51771.1 hypothetical protein CAL25_09570 [Bordetella genomosp. 5]